jgi:hypothetical protein
MELRDWKEEDLQRLVDNGVKESSELEYKSCGALIQTRARSRERIIRDISIDVSSFANAAGGRIVYGIVEENHLPKDLDDGFDPSAVTREWLEDVIDSNIRPRIDGLRIGQVELRQRNPGKVAYVVEIPQGLRGHQANDRRYYQRRNFKAESIEDYQIRDLMNRFGHPLLIPEFSYKEIERTCDIHTNQLVLFLENRGAVAAKNFGIDFLFPEKFIKRDDDNVPVFFPKTKRQGYVGKRFRNYGERVLFPEEPIQIIGPEGGLKLFYEVNQQNWEETFHLKILWTTYADDMPPRKGEVPFKEFHIF